VKGASTRWAAVLVLALLMSAACSSGGGTEDTVPFATLHVLAGAVEVQPGSADFGAAVDGQELVEGSTVRTGPDGRATIEYADGSLTRLDHDTLFTVVSLRAIDGGAGNIEGDQASGSSYHRVVELTATGSRFAIATPTATAAVQGTVYAVWVHVDGATTVAVLQGRVLVGGFDGEVVVEEGFMVVVAADGSLGDPEPLSADLLGDAWILFNCSADGPNACPALTTTTTTPTTTTTTLAPTTTASSFAGTYLGSFPFMIPGPIPFEVDIPFTAIVADAGSVEASFTWAGPYSPPQGGAGTLTIDGSCAGSVDPDGSVRCDGAFSARVEVSGFVVDTPGTFATTGLVVGDALTATIDMTGPVGGGSFSIVLSRQ